MSACCLSSSRPPRPSLSHTAHVSLRFSLAVALRRISLPLSRCSSFVSAFLLLFPFLFLTSKLHPQLQTLLLRRSSFCHTTTLSRFLTLSFCSTRLPSCSTRQKRHVWRAAEARRGGVAAVGRLSGGPAPGCSRPEPHNQSCECCCCRPGRHHGRCGVRCCRYARGDTLLRSVFTARVLACSLSLLSMPQPLDCFIFIGLPLWV